jgi:recombination protein RecA
LSLELSRPLQNVTKIVKSSSPGLTGGSGSFKDFLDSGSGLPRTGYGVRNDEKGVIQRSPFSFELSTINDSTNYYAIIVINVLNALNETNRIDQTDQIDGIDTQYGGIDMADQTDRNKAVEQAISQIEKQFGHGSIMKMNYEKVIDIPFISTGSLALDIALGIGGVPRGRVIEIFGPEASGKTTLALHITAEAQKLGGMVAFIDAEHALDIAYARKLGVDVDSLLVSQPDSGEQALDIAEILVRSGAIDALVIDSVAALVPRAEIEGDMGDQHMGLQARLMSQALRKLTGTISKSRTCVIFINQIRMKIGIMFGSPETTTGGNALKFYASQRLDIRRLASIKDGNEVVGNRTKVKVVKNKIAPPFKEAEFDIIYGHGISKEGDILDLAVTLDIVEKSGAWYTFEGERIGQGRENAKKFLIENEDITNRIADMVRDKTGLKKPGAETKGGDKD